MTIIAQELRGLLTDDFPGHHTLAEVKATFLLHEGPKIHQVLSASHRNLPPIVLRFLDSQGQDLPDSMTIEQMRTLVREGKAILSVEDREGRIKRGPEGMPTETL